MNCDIHVDISISSAFRRPTTRTAPSSKGSHVLVLNFGLNLLGSTRCSQHDEADEPSRVRLSLNSSSAWPGLPFSYKNQKKSSANQCRD